jgi:hypothetical protein
MAIYRPSGILDKITFMTTQLNVGVLKPLVLGYCDNSMREKDWLCHKREPQATKARQGDLA